jgi:hypothetical protein
MSNIDNARGLIPLRHGAGGVIRPEWFTIASGYAANIGRGDVVELTGTGKNIQVAAGGNVDNLGVFWGCSYTDPSTGEWVHSKYWPTGKVAADAQAMVFADPQIVFLAQADTIAEADVGLLADWDDGTMSTTTGLSGREIVVSSGATTGQALRVVGLAANQDNAYGAHADIEVMFAEHVRLNVVSGVGGV